MPAKRRSDVFDEVREIVGDGNTTERCSSDECTVFMDKIPSPRVIVNMDSPPLQDRIGGGRRCDYLLFCEHPLHGSLVLSPIELKSGQLKMSHTTDQLQGGARFAESIVGSLSGSPNFDFRPILIHGDMHGRIWYRNISKYTVTFMERPYRIDNALCGKPENLWAALTSKERSEPEGSVW